MRGFQPGCGGGGEQLGKKGGWEVGASVQDETMNSTTQEGKAKTELLPPNQKNPQSALYKLQEKKQINR